MRKFCQRMAGPGLYSSLDVIERVVVLLLYGPLVWHLLSTYTQTGSWVLLILMVSEGATVGFILVRRMTRAVSTKPTDWILASLATSAPLLARPGGADASVPEVVCALLMLCGFIFQIAAKLTLRRSFGIVAANRGVKIGGPYAWVRHPMYAGYTLTHIGFLLSSPTWWNIAIYGLGFSCQILRLRAEENLLGQDPHYQAFSAAVRYRLLPGVF
jgi:protein-S-isoprenylcysteine O-methyltransferase Ste14